MTGTYEEGFIQGLRHARAILEGDDYERLEAFDEALYDEIMFYTQEFGEEI